MLTKVKMYLFQYNSLVPILVNRRHAGQSGLNVMMTFDLKSFHFETPSLALVAVMVAVVNDFYYR